MKKFFSRITQTIAIFAFMTMAGIASAQQTYPNKPIRFIVLFPPGGANNVLARIVGQKLTESWGQPVIVENRPGGNTVIGSEHVAKSAPDGYTIMLMSVTHVINPSLFPTPYDAIRDFAPVATISNTPLILALNPAVPANNLQEFIALAKSKPGQLNYATPGSGGINHIAAEVFTSMAGVKLQHIPYKGSAQAMTDVIGGQVHLTFQGPINVAPHIKSGKLRALGVSGESRLTALPQLPTFTEGGLPGYDVQIWYGVLAPAGTPRDIVNKLSGEIAKMLTLPDMKDNLLNQGMAPLINNPDQFGALMKTDLARFARIIKSANIKFEE